MTSGESGCRRDLGPHQAAERQRLGAGSSSSRISPSGSSIVAALSNRSRRSPCIITSESTVPGTTAGRREISSTQPARLLAAADAFHAMGEERAHRPALTAEDAAGCLLDDVDGGRFARAEVDAVLGAAGQLPRLPNVPRPAGLTEREVDVLRLIARGHVNKQVAAELGISPKTVGHHVEHIYAKAGVTTRAGAALFAMENGLLTR